MKKQLFLLFVALFALGINSVVAQKAVQGSAPRGVGASCTDDALHPIAGKEYTYQAASNQTGTNFTFWATKDPNFISVASGTPTTNMASTMLKSSTTTPSGTDLITTSSNYATAGTTDNVKITWSDAVLAATTATAPTFVAVNGDGTCTNNFRIWAIQPINAFTVDIRNIKNADMTPMAYEAVDEQCFDKVQTATYNSGTQKVDYDFGKQVLYFEVIAANFTGSYTPTFSLSALGGGQSAVIQWAYDKAFTNPVTVTSGTPSATPVATDATTTTGGVSIYVKVTITNTNFEGIAQETVSLTVDAQNAANQWDIANNTTTDPGPLCNQTTAADGADVATQKINPRPTITPVAPTTFVTPNVQ